jgi:serine/threonine-protein kinase
VKGAESTIKSRGDRRTAPTVALPESAFAPAAWLPPVLPIAAFPAPGRALRRTDAARRGAGAGAATQATSGRSAPSRPAAPRRDARPRDDGGRERMHGRRGLPRGAVIDRYRIEELIGAGSFAAVYRATHLLLHTTVAIKLLHERVVRDDASFVDMLVAEARNIARLNHPNVVRVFDVARTANFAYIVMEHVPGETLAKRIERGALPPADVLRIGIDVAAGLAAAEAAGLVHRDVKPSNIVLSTDGPARLVDLGLSRAAETPAARGSRDRRVAGTPAYMAPEQATAAAPADFRADVYALGATLCHAATGHPPFAHRTAGDVAEAARAGRLDPALLRLDGIHAPLAALLRRMLAPQPGARPAPYGILLTELRAVLADLPGPAGGNS